MNDSIVISLLIIIAIFSILHWYDHSPVVHSCRKTIIRRKKAIAQRIKNLGKPVRNFIREKKNGRL